MPKPTDPLAAALEAAVPSSFGGQSKINMMFSDRPEVLEAIRRARTERKLGYAQIARIIAKIEPSAAVSANTVGHWLRGQGID